MKKMMACILALFLVLAMAGTAVQAAAEKPTLPFVEPGSESLSILSADNWYAAASFADNLPVYEELEKLTGVHINWEVVSADQYGEVRNTRIAAGINLPDIVVWPTSLVKMANDGVYLTLTDLIKENAYYLNMLMDMNNLVRKANTASDGQIYGFPGMGEGILSSYKDMERGSIDPPGANINLMMPSIRKDWLDKLGLKAPTNLDEWYEVLKSFKSGDPNGNGIADEIPLAVSWNYQNLFMFAQEYGMYMTGNAQRWGVNGEGKVIYQTLEPKFKDVLVYLNKLYSEGLIDAEYATSSYDKTLEKVTRNVVGAVANEWMSNPPSWTSNLKVAGFTDASFISIKGPADPDGRVKTTNRWPVFAGDTAITKDCKNPELAVKWLDFHLCSPEGLKLQMFGVEGVSYEMVDDKPVYTDFVMKNPDGLGMFEAIRSLGGWGQVSYIQTKDAYLGLYANSPEITDLSTSFAVEDALLPFPNLSLIMTADENEEFNDSFTDADTYINEMVIKYIEGKESLDSFDSFVATAYEMGMTRAIELYQIAYDRFNK